MLSSWERVHQGLHAAVFCQLHQEAAHLAAAIQQKPGQQSDVSGCLNEACHAHIATRACTRCCRIAFQSGASALEAYKAYVLPGLRSSPSNPKSWTVGVHRRRQSTKCTTHHPQLLPLFFSIFLGIPRETHAPCFEFTTIRMLARRCEVRMKSFRAGLLWLRMLCSFSGWPSHAECELTWPMTGPDMCQTASLGTWVE